MSEIRVPEDRVQRYDAVLATDVCGNKDVVMRERVDGLFVRHEDYARVEAERDEARKALAAMTEDRDLWRGEHESDCPYQEQTKVLRDRVAQRDRQIAAYNSGGFADSDAMAEKYLDMVEQVKVLREALAQPVSDEEWRPLPELRASRNEVNALLANRIAALNSGERPK